MSVHVQESTVFQFQSIYGCLLGRGTFGYQYKFGISCLQKFCIVNLVHVASKS